VRSFLLAHANAWVHVDVWLIPLTPWCVLILFRIILWRRFGILAGLLEGTPTAAHVWSHGIRRADVAALIEHLVALWVAAEWPHGSAPILLSGTDEDNVQKVRAALADRGANAEQCSRLKAFNATFSERGATKGFVTTDFLRAPTQPRFADCTIVRRARAALAAAGVPQNRTCKLDADNSAGAAFRRMLFPC
jgi:hypothetical protein